MTKRGHWKVFPNKEAVDKGVREGNRLIIRALAKKKYVTAVKCEGGWRVSRTAAGALAEKIIGGFHRL